MPTLPTREQSRVVYERAVVEPLLPTKQESTPEDEKPPSNSIPPARVQLKARSDLSEDKDKQNQNVKSDIPAADDDNNSLSASSVDTLCWRTDGDGKDEPEEEETRATNGVVLRPRDTARLTIDVLGLGWSYTANFFNVTPTLIDMVGLLPNRVFDARPAVRTKVWNVPEAGIDKATETQAIQEHITAVFDTPNFRVRTVRRMGTCNFFEEEVESEQRPQTFGPRTMASKESPLPPVATKEEPVDTALPNKEALAEVFAKQEWSLCETNSAPQSEPEAEDKEMERETPQLVPQLINQKLATQCKKE